MADVGPDSDGASDRAQLLLVTALALAVMLVTVALLLNTAIFTENVATRDTTADGREAVELRGEAVGNLDFRATFTAMDDRIRDRVIAEIEAGVERGQFAVANPETAATDLTMLLNGALLESATTDHDITEQARATLHARIDALAEGSDE